jgi:hypothetical protein
LPRKRRNRFSQPKLYTGAWGLPGPLLFGVALHPPCRQKSAD